MSLRQGALPNPDTVETLLELPRDLRALTITRVPHVNPNAYIYFLQQNLAGRGLYDGSINGCLGGRTIRAINVSCSSREGSTCTNPLAGASGQFIVNPS